MTTTARARWKQRLERASHSRSFLWKFGLLSLLVGTAVGLILDQLLSAEPWMFGERVLAHAGLTAEDDEPEEDLDQLAPSISTAFVQELATTAPRLIDVLWAVPDLAPFLNASAADGLAEALTAQLGSSEAELVMLYLAASDLKNRDARERLLALARSPEPPRYARFAAGQIELELENYAAAYELFRQEADAHPGATESRFLAVRALVEAKDFERLATLRADERFTRYFDSTVDLEIAIARRDWVGIVRHIVRSQIESYQSAAVLVALVAALGWALFLKNLGQVRSGVSAPVLLSGLGFAAGVISTTLTVFLVVVQDDILGLTEGETAQQQFVYFIAGVGLREEFAKLVFFAILLPFLLKRDDELEALVVASFVGLGFAIEENVGYYLDSQGSSAPGRFLTANFLHLALTGANGLALFRACARIGGGWNEFLTVFPLTVVAHGAYDALIDLPDFAEASFFGTIVFVLICLYYFRCAHPLRSNARTTISLTGSFVFGISTLAATVIAYQMATLGAAAGATLIFGEIIGSGVLLLVFFMEFREALEP